MGDVKDYMDRSEHFDYVADIINPTMALGKREALAERCMRGLFTEGSSQLYGDPARYDAAHILQQLAIRLMGQAWCQQWLHENNIRIEAEE